MVAELEKAKASGLNVDTMYAGSPTFVNVRLWATSGLIAVPVLCDSAGKIDTV